ncbi:hypothetical protein EGW08_018634 [Elysia chlorotica]|uniref:Cadherin domain-containing protein n=1 Tax=Elysia chlorotica TaxID=188477 RepID=A0A3S0ZB14_ELYCH|nr:hypothetical protein EGW08_018634 [Elysia chlorotica]
MSDSFSSFSITDAGKITILASLDREKKESYNLLVYAEDNFEGKVYRSARQVVVRLTDTDDNEPTFTNPNNYAQCQGIASLLTLRVSENTPVNTTVYTLSACDPDSAENSMVIYELEDSYSTCGQANDESALGLNSATGELFIKRIMDREQRDNYSLCVIVKPQVSSTRVKRSLVLSDADKSQKNVVYINIVVVDENDNGPKFPEKELTAVVLTQPRAGPVIILEAVDPDSDVNNVIKYRITKSEFITRSGEAQASADVFKLPQDNGALYSDLSSFQSFLGGRFVLTVQAVDALKSSFTDEVQVEIFVYEEGQAVKVILDAAPAAAIDYSREMIKELDGVSMKYAFTYLQLSDHKTKDGIEPSKTDVCFLVVNTEDNTILDIRQVISLMYTSEYQSATQGRYSVVDRGQCEPRESSEDDVRWRDLWWVLVAVAIFIFVCCIILIVLVVLLYNKYRRYMETRQTYLVGQ